MSDTTINLTSTVYSYLKNNSLREPEVLKQLRNETNKKFQARMQISPEQGQFMRLLVEILNAKKSLDIGTFTGYSALAVALSLPDNGKVIACDTSVEWTNLAKHFWEIGNVAHKIDLKLAPALQTLDKLLTDGEVNTFDFVFIDADKQNYIAYYEKSLALLRTGGLIAIDNVLWGGRVADPTIHDTDTVIIRQLNSKILTDERVTISMLPIGDGLTLARKK
ncbi:MAG: SAM-dependent methyltransferase [Gammaproteobacteria bacterium RIFCSPHIGHO2_12_FULL_37_14]|nr:MAG: SAM-dependent methyltransferase [Gammaproteobacteria bacterium RIFCSPHIGHO2_12_FULL_37_14]